MNVVGFVFLEDESSGVTLAGESLSLTKFDLFF